MHEVFLNSHPELNRDLNQALATAFNNREIPCYLPCVGASRINPADLLVGVNTSRRVLAVHLNANEDWGAVTAYAATQGKEVIMLTSESKELTPLVRAMSTYIVQVDNLAAVEGYASELAKLIIR